MTTTIEDRMRAVIVARLGPKAASAEADARFMEDLGADSLDCVELRMGIEEEFSIEISDEEAAALQSIGALKDYLERRVRVEDRLAALAREAVARFEALSPEEQVAHRQAQAESWARGEAGIGSDADEAAARARFRAGRAP